MRPGPSPTSSLQGLRLAGTLLPLGLGWLWAQKPRFGLQLSAFLALILALYARAFVKGFALSWGLLGSWLGWKYLLLYAFSDLLILHAWGLRKDANP